MHRGRSIGRAVAGSCQPPSAGSVGPCSGEITFGEAAICFQHQSLDAGLAERQHGRHAGSPSRIRRPSGRLFWRRGTMVSGAGPAAPVRSCPSGSSGSVSPCLTPTEPGSSRTTGQALDMAGRPGLSGRSAMSSRAGGGWCSLVSTVASGGRRPRRGCAMAMSPSGRANRWTWRTRSAAVSPEPFPPSARRHVAPASGIILGAVLMCGRCAGLFISTTAIIIWPSNCRINNLPPSSVGRAHP